MTLEFPNQARRFDASKSCVRFWGYDAVMEVSFFVDATALQKLSPQLGSSESELMKAFDDSIDRIYVAAQRVYKRGKKGSYVYLLSAADV